MGLYDTYGDVQLKVGDVEMRHYAVGDHVPLNDGLYAGYGGIVVIVGGKFVAQFTSLRDKWGGCLDLNLDASNPIVQALQGYTGGENFP